MIKISNLSKNFNGETVLNNISIEIQDKEVVAIIGSSGAGKSTLLRSINYLVEADSGQLQIGDTRVDFEKITKDQILQLRRMTAMVFQQFNLFERRTVLKNVMEGLTQVKKLSKEEAEKIARDELIKVGLADRMNYFPKFLSGGQKQRVGIARALAMKPELLLLDEPTSALDPELVGEVQESIIQAAHQGQTMLLVSHEMDFVYEVANKVFFLDQGKIVEFGNPKNIFNNPKSDRLKQFLSNNKRFGV
ncbi:amino acid ABC transporter ATP-binding protein [Lactovum miscens]|uniref:Polar amino acid transport system ATP-binding protein n=1 Tax=Lactovum miscens TaxID=190387 RepID=A0A841C5A7_9LACT|nr:amino acid ABC transporter ATP-binding protein [Lactovum miscens]MBB5887534.1 polar amino acid transport system ATP-binding protein [Lactovum miscens]